MTTPPLLTVQHLTKQFLLKGQLLRAVEDFSLTLSQGEILGIGGESGCGKSTLAKLLMGLMTPTSGSILLKGQNLSHLIKQKSQGWRREIQMIFQHPASSLDPRLTIEKILAEPLIIHGIAKGQELTKRAANLLSQVALSEDYLKRLPHELSGGQKQRIAIARAMALEPQLIICDEPFSALDVSVQAQMINLLTDLHRKKNLSYLIISHDLSILRYLTDNMAIMYLGQMVEYGPSQEVYNHPLHPYSQDLISAVLEPNPEKERLRTQVVVKGEVPGLLNPPKGCPFYSRCSYAQKICQTVRPQWQEVKPGHFTACHLFNRPLA